MTTNENKQPVEHAVFSDAEIVAFEGFEPIGLALFYFDRLNADGRTHRQMVENLLAARASAAQAPFDAVQAQFMFIAMDDDKRAHVTYCRDEKAVRDAVRDAMFMPGPLDNRLSEEIDGVVEELLDSGAMVFEGDAPLYLYRLAAPIAAQAPQELALPKLAEGEEFVCDRGCGATTPEQYDFEYSREEFPDGRVESRTQKAWRSACCRSDVMIYSNKAETFTPIEDYAGPVAPAAVTPSDALTPEAREFLYPDVSSLAAAQPDERTAPFSNCSFRNCDLPGQCREEGKCHHPALASAPHPYEVAQAPRDETPAASVSAFSGVFGDIGNFDTSDPLVVQDANDYLRHAQDRDEKLAMLRNARG